MPDLEVRSPGHPPWLPRPDPWWVWAIRIVFVVLLLVVVVGTPVQLLWA